MPSLWSREPYDPVPRRLRAGAPNRSTVCTGARLRTGLGFYALKSVCARFEAQGCEL
jgi:hypothetical protein